MHLIDDGSLKDITINVQHIDADLTSNTTISIHLQLI